MPHVTLSHQNSGKSSNTLINNLARLNNKGPSLLAFAFSASSSSCCTHFHLRPLLLYFSSSSSSAFCSYSCTTILFLLFHSLSPPLSPFRSAPAPTLPRPPLLLSPSYTPQLIVVIYNAKRSKRQLFNSVEKQRNDSA